mmetsp:Transcript_17447/g.38138  ORF Transcript_17447/g.38138 Transcript_17447/m.38138 type:complete len:90 (+) Transcript_17447:301-570(+)
MLLIPELLKAPPPLRRRRRSKSLETPEAVKEREAQGLAGGRGVKTCCHFVQLSDQHASAPLLDTSGEIPSISASFGHFGDQPTKRGNIE